MSELSFPANAKIVGIAEQVDADSPATEPDFYFQLKAINESPVRAGGPLEWTDRSAQEGAVHVTAINPGVTFDTYCLFSDLQAWLAEALLWDADVDGTNGTTEATPTLTPKYYTLWLIEPGMYTDRYDGVVLTEATFAAQDEGQTELNVTGIAFLALGFTAHVAEPSPLPDPITEVPPIYAEATVSYDGVSEGKTRAFTITVTRNVTRIPGDAGFRGYGMAPGKLSVKGSVTIVMTDDDLRRAVQTGSPTGTTPTTDIATASLSIAFDRPDDSKALEFACAEIAWLFELSEPIELDGKPKTQVIPFQTQPQATLAGNITITAQA